MFFKNLFLGLVRLVRFLMVLLVVGLFAQFAGASENKSKVSAGVEVGVVMAQGPTQFAQVVKQLGEVDYVKIYINLVKTDVAEIPKSYRQNVSRQLDAGLGVTLVVTLHGATLREVLRGDLDDKFRALAKAIQKDGRQIGLVMLHEANAGNYSWSVRDGATSADFVQAYVKLVKLIRGEGVTNVLFDLNLNRVSRYKKGDNTPQSRVADFAQYYPGDEYVDRISISGFNRCGLSKWHTKWLSFEEVFAFSYQAVVAMAGKSMPIGIAETSTTGLCGGDKIAWFGDMAQAVEVKFPRIKFVTLFLETVPKGKASNEVAINWEPQSAAQWKSLRDGVAQMRGGKVKKVKKEFGKKQVLQKQSQQVDLRKIEADSFAVKSAVRYPWTVRSKVEAFDDVSNNAQNSVTGQQFGGRGDIFSLYIAQGIAAPTNALYLDGDLITSVYADVRLSNNNNRWWDNRVATGVKVQQCGGKPDFADWGSICVFANAQFVKYVVDVPSRLSDGEAIYSIGISTNFGGSDRWW